MIEQLKQKTKTFFESRVNRLMTAVFFLVFILNFLTVKTSDDLGYSINRGFIDMFRLEYVQYMNWTGRSVAHIIARIFLSLPKMIFNICNSLLFAVFIKLIAMHAAGEKEKVTPMLYGLSALAVFLFVPLFGQTVLWETGSCNYLWTTSIILFFLWFYREALTKNEPKPVWFLAVYFLLGIIAGWTNENTGGACILMITCFLFVYFRRHIRHEPWMYMGLFGAVLGFLTLILAPGNAIRAQDFVNSGGKAYEIVHDIVNFINVVGTPSAQLPLWIAFGVFTGLAILQKTAVNELFVSASYAAAGAAAVFAIVLTPVSVEFDRSMFGATVLIIIGALGILALLEQDKMKNILCAGLAGALSVLAVRNYGYALNDLAYTRYQYQVREAWVYEQKQMWNLSPVVPEINSEFFTKYNAMYGLNDILESETFVNNRNYALIHGLNFVTSTTLERWNELYRNGDPTLMNLFELEAYLDTLLTRIDCYSIVTSTRLDEGCESMINMLNSKYHTSFEGEGYISGLIYSDGNALRMNADPEDQYCAVDSDYIYIHTDPDPEFADILFNARELTNNNAGLSIVTIQKDTGRILDSVTWSSLETRGPRHYASN